MVTFARRAHYFAHYIADGTRNELCQDDKDCPFATVLVPEKRD
jgi:hypothetical protein